MSCAAYRELISAELDDELNPEEKASLKSHLAQCAACRSLRERLSLVEKGFARLPEVAPPPLRPRPTLATSNSRGSAGAAALWTTLLAAAACAALVFWPASKPSGSDGVALYLSPHSLQTDPPQEQAVGVSEFRSQPLYGQVLRNRELAFEIQLDSHQQACRDLRLEVDYDFDNDGKVDRSEVYSSFDTDSQDGWEVYRSGTAGYSHQGEARNFSGGTVSVRLRNANGELQMLQGRSKLILPYQLNS
ncbi:zf-HC2 domain-containing protein [bacterium]|nr:zf-HC2 domain-containing protein [bacterium]